MTITALDAAFLILILLLAARGFLRGFVREFFACASLALGLVAARLWYVNGAALIRTRVLGETRYLPEVLAFVALFAGVFLAVKVVEKIVREVVEGVRLGAVDKALGALFGAAEGFAGAALVLVVLSLQPLFDAGPLLERGVFAGFLLPLIGEVPWKAVVTAAAAAAAATHV